MKKINSSNSRKIWIITSIAAILLIAGGTVAYYYIANSNNNSVNREPAPNNTVDYDAPSEEQKQAGVDSKKDFIERNEESQASSEPGGLSSVSISSVVQEEGILKVRAVINSNTNGNCRLTLSMAGQNDVVREVDTQDMGTYSTCKGFDLDTKSIAKGSWKITLHFSGDASGSDATSSVEVK